MAYGYEHFTEAVPDIKNLKRSIDWHRWQQGIRDGIEEQINHLEDLLLWCIEQTEFEDMIKRCGVGPYYYDELSKLYKNMGRTDLQINILERFAKQNHALGARPPRLLERLDKLRSQL